MANTYNHDPLFAGTVFHWDAELTTQTFTRAGGATTGTTPVLLGMAGDTGAIVTSVTVTVSGNTGAANVLALFTLRDGATNARLRAEATLPQVSTAANTAAIAGYPIRLTLPDQEPFEAGTASFLKLEPGESLYCALLASEVAGKFFVHCVGGLYDQA